MMYATTYAEAQEDWGLDHEIQQIKRLADVWRHHSEAYPEGDYGELVKSIAGGYLLHLELLYAARAGSSATSTAAADLTNFNHSARAA